MQASSWISRLRTSDPSVMEEVFDDLHAPLLRYAGQITRDEGDAYDVLQDVFFKLWEIRHSLDPSRSLPALLYKMVRNRALNELRRARHRMADLTDLEEVMEDKHPAPDDGVDVALLGAQIHRWIGEMPPRRREAFQLSRFAGLSHEEIADVMNLTARTVSNHIMLALVFLRDRLRAFQANTAGL